ncbi:hypothetical protein ABT063_27720 [Streptomyces sp. NPDC002838]|uniref:hypothetical protein n=1 Tax=Streptomyces sp. NPDC002838 TaxID=3154436 RepID=UPI0033334A43
MTIKYLEDDFAAAFVNGLAGLRPDGSEEEGPGRFRGRHLARNGAGRLHKIGIRPKQDRSTALFTLATELPAAILARMLGVHIKVAVQWQQASGGDWAAYAADVSRRTRPT